jgi:hypothetical protein
MIFQVRQQGRSARWVVRLNDATTALTSTKSKRSLMLSMRPATLTKPVVKHRCGFAIEPEPNGSFERCLTPHFVPRHDSALRAYPVLFRKTLIGDVCLHGDRKPQTVRRNQPFRTSIQQIHLSLRGLKMI